MDKSWITTSKLGDSKYNVGVIEFVRFALENNVDGRDKLPCPCYMCHNLMHHKVEEILRHLKKWEFDRTYTCWHRHGEKPKETTTRGIESRSKGDEEKLEDMMTRFEERVEDDPNVVEELLSDSERPLYTGCSKYNKLSAVLKLYNLKVAHSWTDQSFSALLELLIDMFPLGNLLPSNTYEAKKILCTMGLRYEKIHACPNDCILYRTTKYESLESCPECNLSRYKKKKGVPAKVLWYFPIIPRFKRMYSNPIDAEKLTWHKFGRKKDDGLLRHPADSPQWRFIDAEFSDFGKEERNLRLGLSTDGMNPFRSLSSTHSTWPVMLITYNLPPSLCMKRKYIMLSMLISGPKQPGNDIDVYLEPLIEDLKLLWEEGVQVFDGNRKEMFNLKAMLFCTIQDYPAYGNLSGYPTKSKCGCCICEDGWEGKWLNASRKTVYHDHRAFLPHDHGYRRLKKAFNGEQNFTSRPKVLTSQEVFDKVKDIKIKFGKLKKNVSALPKKGYKKCSCFWRLPYWKCLFVRHSLDVMHIEKNFFDSLLGTLLNIPGKTKDGRNARQDLKNMKIRDELHVVTTEKRSYLPPAAYTLSKEEKVELCTSLASVKVPEGYSSNLSSLVSIENLKLMGLKSHDCHVLMEDILPIAIRAILPKNVRFSITRLCFFFKAIYNKVINPKDLDSLEAEIIVVLCQLETYFPPAFFDISIHLPIHLIREIRFCGPVHMRSQWAFERQMKTYKGYVKNAFRPEACIAERMLYELAMEYSIENLGSMKTIGVPTSRHDDKVDGEGTIGRKEIDMSLEKWHMAHTYILFNEDEVEPYLKRHMVFLKARNRKANPKTLAMEHRKSFRIWFKDEIMKELQVSSSAISDRLKSLSYGPDFSASFYSGYVINGCTFYTRDQDTKSTMQNSGVSLEAEAIHVSSAKDKSPICAKMQYYGVIEEICELHYLGFPTMVTATEQVRLKHLFPQGVDSMCSLAIEKDDWLDVVAHGHVYVPRDGQVVNHHFKPVPADHYRVSITEEVNSNALLPCPEGEIRYVCQGKDNFLLWPVHLVIPRNKVLKANEQPTKEITTSPVRSPSSQGSSTRRYMITAEDKLKLTSNLVKVFKDVAMGMKKNGKTKSFTVPAKVFQNEHTVILDFEDMLDWCFQKEIGSSHMSILMMYLGEMVHTEGISGLFGFCDSNILSPETPTRKNEDDRCDYLSRVFACNDAKNKNQLFFAPYNEGHHWMLAVICPWVGLVHWLDPAGVENEPREFAKTIINKAIIKFSTEYRKDISKIKKNPYIRWKKIECPRQILGSKDCGYYVRRYMVEIIESRQLFVPEKYFDKTPSTYTQQMIDELREAWISYVTGYHQPENDDDDLLEH